MLSTLYAMFNVILQVDRKLYHCYKHALFYTGSKNAKAIQCPKIKDKNRQTNTTPWRNKVNKVIKMRKMPIQPF